MHNSLFTYITSYIFAKVSINRCISGEVTTVFYCKSLTFNKISRKTDGNVESHTIRKDGANSIKMFRERVRRKTPDLYTFT